MKISTKLVLNFGLFFIFSLTVLAGFFFMTSHTENSIQDNNLIEQLLDGFNDLNTVTYGNALYPGDRPRVQWELKHASLGNLLKRVNSEETAVLARMGENHRLAKMLFDDLIRRFQEQNSQALGPNDNEGTERIISQLIARTQMMRADALVLKHASNAHLLSTQREWFWIVTGIILIMLASVTWVSFFLKRRITGSLSILTQGTEIIRDGNLDYRTGIASKDEIGRLSRSFDDMAENLKNTLVSRDALQREVEEKMRAEDALRESAQRWATTLASIGDAVIATDVDGRITFMNAIAETMTGWELPEASLKPVAEVFHIVNEQTRQKAENPVHKVLEKGNIVGLANHTVLVRKDGAEVPIDDSAAPIKDKDGKVTGVVLVFRDITERKQAEEALRKSRDELEIRVQERTAELGRASRYARSLIEASPDPLVTISRDGKIMDVNGATESATGISRNALIGTDFSEYFTEPEKAREGYRQVFSEGSVRDYPLVMRHNSDRITEVLYNATVYQNEAGEIQGVFAAARDITGRRRAEEALKAEQKRLYDVLETLPVMICLLTPDYHVAFANRSFREKFGEAGGRRCYEYCFGNTAPCDFCESYKVLETGQPHQWEVKSPEGTGVISAYDFPFTDVDGSPLILEMDIDITEHRRAEAALKERTGELAKSQERLQQLASQLLLAQEKERKRVAVELHDGLLSELAATKYLLEGKVMQLDRGKAVEPGELRRVADILGVAMKEARRLMNNLHPSMLDELGLLATIGWVCGEYQKSYPHITVEKEIAIPEKDIAADVKVVIYRVLQEALNNFARHGKGNRVALSLSKLNGTFALAIRDNGQGFDLENVQKGLGLESMQERVELSGGKFQIESAIGQGTTIRAIWST